MSELHEEAEEALKNWVHQEKLDMAHRVSTQMLNPNPLNMHVCVIKINEKAMRTNIVALKALRFLLTTAASGNQVNESAETEPKQRHIIIILCGFISTQDSFHMTHSHLIHC